MDIGTGALVLVIILFLKSHGKNVQKVLRKITKKND